MSRQEPITPVGPSSKLMLNVGKKVRALREEMGVPRRLLSETSGVSPRYLAQLEAGEGNISIRRLEQVAIALGQQIEWFVGDDVQPASGTARLNALFYAADPAMQEHVLDLLVKSSAKDRKAQRICLIGLRGAGKSTLGAAAANALEVPFVEFNDLVEDTAGIPVAEIMALYGVEGYRQLEADALSKLVENYPRVIVAAAGGIVSEQATYAKLLNSFHAIWIKAAPEEHMDRVRAQGDTRPMTGKPQAMMQLRAILSSREAFYARADSIIDTTGARLDTSLKDLLNLIEARNYLAEV